MGGGGGVGSGSPRVTPGACVHTGVSLQCPPIPLPRGPGFNFAGTLCKARPGTLGGYSVPRLGEALSGHFVGLGGWGWGFNVLETTSRTPPFVLFIHFSPRGRLGGGGHGWRPRGFCHRVGVGTPPLGRPVTEAGPARGEPLPAVTPPSLSRAGGVSFTRGAAPRCFSSSTARPPGKAPDRSPSVSLMIRGGFGQTPPP